MDHATPPALAAPPQVMLLSVWLDTAAVWHARLLTPDAQVHEFTSPFDLAQFLCRSACARPLAGDVGLR